MVTQKKTREKIAPMLSKQLLEIIDNNINKIAEKEDKFFDIYIKLSSKTEVFWVRIVVYAYSTYVKIAYTIDKNKKDASETQLFILGCDHDSAWRHEILSGILKKEKRFPFSYKGFINTFYLSTGFVEKIENENLLFVDGDYCKLLIR